MRRSSSRQPSAPSRYRKWGCPLPSCLSAPSRRWASTPTWISPCASRTWAPRSSPMAVLTPTPHRCEAYSAAVTSRHPPPPAFTSTTCPLPLPCNPGCWTLNALRYCGDPRAHCTAPDPWAAPFASLPSNLTCRRPQGPYTPQSRQSATEAQTLPSMATSTFPW